MEYELCQKLQAKLANQITIHHIYKKWGPEFFLEETERLFSKLKKDYVIHVERLSRKELISLGALKWSKETSLYLLPFWLAPFLAHGTKLTCINGKIVTVGAGEIDMDERYGCIAYGVFVE